MGGKWDPYGGFDNELLEEGYQAYKATGAETFSSSRFQFARGATYEINFGAMTQTNTKTNKSRNIQRRDGAPAMGGGSPEGPVAAARVSPSPKESPKPSPQRSREPSPAPDPSDATNDARMAPPIVPQPLGRELSGTLGSHGGDSAANAAAYPDPDDDDSQRRTPDLEQNGADHEHHIQYQRRQMTFKLPSYAPIVGGCCCIGILLTIILLPLSFNYVPPNTVGIKIDKTSRRVSLDNYYPEGRYFLGPTVDFFLFPTDVQTLDDSITARALDGYAIRIAYAVQYQLVPEKIVDLYKKHNLKYGTIYRRIARERVLAAIGNHDSNGFYRDREEILNMMFSDICEKLYPEHAKCWGMQFTEINLAPQLETRLLRLELDRWYVRKKKAEQAVSEVTSVTEVVEADFQMRISNVKSSSDANASIIELGAQSGSTILTRTSAADAAIITRDAEKTATITEKTAKMQCDEITVKAENQARGIEFQALADALLLKEEAKANASEIISTAKAAAHKTYAVAYGEAKAREITAQGNALQYMRNRMTISPNGLNRYDKTRVVAKYDEAKKVTLGFTQTFTIQDLRPWQNEDGSRRLHEKREHSSNAEEPSVSCFSMTPGNSCGSKHEWRSGLMGYKMLRPNATAGHFATKQVHRRPGESRRLHEQLHHHHHEDTEL